MLVVRAKPGFCIQVGPSIFLVVHEVDPKRGVVRIGIEAPKDVNVLREEIFTQLCNENRAATQQTESLLQIMEELNADE